MRSSGRPHQGGGKCRARIYRSPADGSRLRPTASPGWLRMNIKVKLPFLFTFLQLRRATCSGQRWLCSPSSRKSERAESRRSNPAPCSSGSIHWKPRRLESDFRGCLGPAEELQTAGSATRAVTTPSQGDVEKTDPSVAAKNGGGVLPGEGKHILL